MAKKCPQANNWVISEFEAIKTNYRVKVNNYSLGESKIGYVIQSQTFSSEDDIETRWRVEVYPNGKTEPNKEFVSIFLNLVESSKSEVLAEYSLSILDSNQQIYKKFDLKNKFESGKSCGCPKFIRRAIFENLKNLLLPNDVLTIGCKVKYTGKCKTTCGQNIALKRSHEKLLADMTALYQTPNGSDVEIVVKNHRFSAHKVILMARSPVFAAMFTHQMKESLQNKVVINDIEKDVFSSVLRYIYTGNVVNEDIDSSLQLLSAAEKYNLDNLKSICEEYIVSKLTVESVCDVLILADIHWAQKLEAKAIDFIKKNRNQVTKTKGWAKVILERSDLLKLF